MKNWKIGCLFGSLVLIGCGGGGGGDSSADNSDAVPQSSEDQVTIYEKDGIYINSDDLVVMVVDSEASEAGILIGDYVNSEIAYSHTHEVDGNTLNTRGLLYATANSIQIDQDLELTVTFDGSQARVTGTLNNSNLVYSFDKTNASKSMSELAGTHTSPDNGSSWAFDANGSFTINGGGPSCTINGQLTMVKGYYYSGENVVASGCADPGLNGTDYEARFISIDYNGQTYILGAMARTGTDIGLLWGSVPVN
ncbi:hypothetical protein [Vibrio sonorensis]|uniref:hypothetical protein n=1 Tax=Vibrio sonorensis TaxID=1004316 RepID=UPI0008DB3144|nr:hypothetical protein [Vibrio sonorensis]